MARSIYSVDDHGTSHFSIIDNDGNAVAMTSTVNLLCMLAWSLYVFNHYSSRVASRVLVFVKCECCVVGSRVVANGIILNNQMDDFAVDPTQVNSFGVICRSLAVANPVRCAVCTHYHLAHQRARRFRPLPPTLCMLASDRYRPCRR